jgi:hypothetical protein
MLAERIKLGTHQRTNLSILWLGFIFLIAAGARFLYLNRQALFLDEAWSWAASQLTIAEILRLPLQDPEHSAVLMDPAYLAPLAFYYQEENLPVWGLRRNDVGEIFWGQATNGGILLDDLQPLSCDMPQVRRIDQVWIYSAPGDPARLLASRQACLVDTAIYSYQNQQWTLLTP